MEILGPIFSRFATAVATNENEKSLLSETEMSVGSQAEENILSELDSRYKDECKAIQLEIKASPDSVSAINREKEEQLWELATIDGDKTFLTSALSMGLFQRIKMGKNKVG